MKLNAVIAYQVDVVVEEKSARLKLLTLEKFFRN